MKNNSSASKKSKKNAMIKSSRHYFSEANAGKKTKLNEFILECQRVLGLLIDKIWDSGVEWEGPDGEVKICLPSEGYYEVPRFISTKNIGIKTDLSGRAVKCLATQACGIVKSTTKKYTKTLFVIEKLEEKESDGVLDDTGRLILQKLKKKLAKLKPVKPSVGNVAIELNSICADLVRNVGKFDFLELKSIGKKFGKIRLPVSHHRHSRRMESRGELMKSFLVDSRKMDMRWEIEIPVIKEEGLVVGGDTGKNTVLTLSDEQTTNKIHTHGKTLDSIMKKLARKKKGSKGFLKAQTERTNFINWSIKQLNLKNIKQINLEKINNIFYKQKYSRLMSHWTNSEIEKAIKNLCQDSGVQLSYKKSFYCSQRCFNCGLVRRANRNGLDYMCKTCGYSSNADLNSAKNHTLDLPAITDALRRRKLNIKGFYWTLDGFFHLDGSALTVPNTQKRSS